MKKLYFLRDNIMTSIMNFLSISLLSVIFLLSSNFSTASFLVEEKDDLFYVTLHIVTDIGTGTGFIYDFDTSNGSSPYLVTNKHVVYQEEKVGSQVKKIFATMGELKFHTTNRNFYKYNLGNQTNPFFKLFNQHPSGLDLCYLPLVKIIDDINVDLKQYKLPSQELFGPHVLTYIPPAQPSATVFYRTLNSSHLANFQNLESIQDTLMVGYPKGFFDEMNNLPVLRKGIIASHIGKNFQGRPEFLIDAVCLPGSSGSPVFIFPEQVLSQSLGQNLMGTNYSRPRLLGVLWGGPVRNFSGELVCKDDKIECGPIPLKITTSTILPINFGFVIKSTELSNWKTM